MSTDRAHSFKVGDHVRSIGGFLRGVVVEFEGPSKVFVRWHTGVANWKRASDLLPCAGDDAVEQRVRRALRTLSIGEGPTPPHAPPPFKPGDRVQTPSPPSQEKASDMTTPLPPEEVPVFDSSGKIIANFMVSQALVGGIAEHTISLRPVGCRAAVWRTPHRGLSHRLESAFPALPDLEHALSSYGYLLRSDVPWEQAMRTAEDLAKAMESVCHSAAESKAALAVSSVVSPQSKESPVSESKTSKSTLDIAKASLLHGVKVAGVDEASNLVIEAGSTILGPELVAMLSVVPAGRSLIKGIGALTLSYAAELGLLPGVEPSLVQAGAALQLEAVSRDLVQPQLAKLTDMALRLAKITKQSESLGAPVARLSAVSNEHQDELESDVRLASPRGAR